MDKHPSMKNITELNRPIIKYHGMARASLVIFRNVSWVHISIRPFILHNTQIRLGCPAWIRSTWKLPGDHVQCPSYSQTLARASTGSITEERETFEVCSGELFDQCIDIQDPRRNLVTYKLAVPTSAMNIKSAIAPFHSIRIPTLSPPSWAANVLVVGSML